MVVEQGDLWWADFGEPVGSAPGYRSPVVVIQADRLNLTSISTIVCASVTSQLKYAELEGNVLLSTRQTGLDRDSVVNVSQLWSLDRVQFEEWIGRLSHVRLAQVIDGVCGVFGRF